MFEGLETIEIWEMASYVVTVIAMPWAIMLYFIDNRRERKNEDEEIYLALSDEYAKFSKTLLQNADLQLVSGKLTDKDMTDEQRERRKIIFEMLMALFERAYILVYEDNMDKQTKRLWASWEDYIRFWLSHEDFRAALPELLKGEDEDFVRYMNSLKR